MTTARSTADGSSFVARTARYAVPARQRGCTWTSTATPGEDAPLLTSSTSGARASVSRFGAQPVALPSVRAPSSVVRSRATVWVQKPFHE
ncbi:Uncharacterised protein [Mycobacteroides abscessus]|nr:Uncharacterised protein [Mycobacteroides abscessus]